MSITRREKLILFFLIAVFAVGYSLIAVLRHLRFESFGYDLGIYDQAIWLWSQFKEPFSTIKNSHIFGDHLTPVLALLSPLYWIVDDVRILLIFQAVFVATGAIPIYFLAKERLKSAALSLVLTFTYLCFFGIQNGVVFDFHPLVVAVPFLSWWFYFLEKEKSLLVLLLSFFILGLQENLSLLMIALGLVVFWKKRFLGVSIIVLSTCWFLLATKVLMPYFSSKDSFLYFPTKPLLTPLTFLKEVFYPFEKTKTILVSLGAFAFLPIFSPLFLIPIFEQFTERFVGNIVATRWGISLHYSAPLAPILVYGTIKTLENNFFKKRKVILYGIGVFLLSLCLGYQFFLHLPLNMLAKKEFYTPSKNKPEIEKAIKLISAESGVATQNNLIPYLSHRKKIYLFSSCEDVPDPSRGMFCQPLIDKLSDELPLIEKEKVEFILVNFRPGQNPNNFFPDGEERLRKYVEKLLLDKKYKIKFKEEEIILLERI